MSIYTGPAHISRVRTLYKCILKLHRGMPLEMKALGDQYVKAEFRRHKEAEPAFVAQFMKEWTDYAITLAEQLGDKRGAKTLGKQLSEDQLNSLDEQQVGQLYELFQESSKPVDPVDPLGYNPMKDSKQGTTP